MAQMAEKKPNVGKVEKLELLAANQFNVVALAVLVLILSVIGYFLVVRGFGASTALYLAPPSIAVAPGEALAVSVRLSTPEQVKIVRANFKYPADKFDYVGINSAGSAFGVDAGSKGGDGSVVITRSVASGSTVTGDQLVIKVNFKAKSVVGVNSFSFVAGSAVIRASDNVNVLAGTSGGTYAVSAQAGPTGSTTTASTTAADNTNADSSLSDPSGLDSVGGDGLTADSANTKPSLLVWILGALGILVGIAAVVWGILKFGLPWLRSRRAGGMKIDISSGATSLQPSDWPSAASLGAAPSPTAGQPVALSTNQFGLPAASQPAIASIAAPTPMPMTQPMAPAPGLSSPVILPPNPPFVMAAPLPVVSAAAVPSPQPSVSQAAVIAVAPVAAASLQPSPVMSVTDQRVVQSVGVGPSVSATGQVMSGPPVGQPQIQAAPPTAAAPAPAPVVPPTSF